MSNIFDFCEEFHISHAKARKMEKAGFLRFNDEPDELGVIRNTLAKGNELTAAQLCQLVELPALVLELGRYAERAEQQIAALGKVHAAPKEVVAYITDAAKNDRDSVDALLNWLREIIPTKPVSHSYIAVRLLLGLAPNIRRFDVPRIPRALLNCRKRTEFAGYWRVEKRPSRNVTIYQRPAKNSFDL